MFYSLIISIPVYAVAIPSPSIERLWIIRAESQLEKL